MLAARSKATSRILFPSFRREEGLCTNASELWHNSRRSPQQQHPLWHQVQTLCEEGRLDQALDRLDQHSTPPPDAVYLSLLKACSKNKALPQAKRIHAHLSHHSLHLSSFLGENLLLTLAKCGGLDDARDLFHKLPCRTVFSWTAVISGFTEFGRGLDALHMHQSMLQDGIEPDPYTFASLFKACGSIPDIEYGRNLHAVARTKGFTSDLFVLTSLLSMYAKCGAIKEAEGVFCGLPQPDVVSWNAMLSAYVDHSQGEKALQVYRQMHEEGMHPSHQTIVIALQACGIVAEKEEAQHVHGKSALEVGDALHAHARRKGWASHVFVHTTLVSMYGKCGTVVEAENVFTGQLQHHLTLWNAMLSAYVEQGHGEKALQLFKQMQAEGISPDQRTYVVALQACVTLAERDEDNLVKARTTRVLALEIGQALHTDAQKKDFASDVFVGTTLVSLYGKCGSIAKAENVFGALSQFTGIAWNAMLSAYVEQGRGEKVLLLYKQMQMKRVPLDVTSLICILQACSEIGSVDICCQLHFVIVSTEHDTNLFLRSALIHAYGGCASMEDAQSVFVGLPHVDGVSWNACIAGYAGEGNYVASVQMVEEIYLAGFTPDGVTFASVISACNHAGLVNKGVEYFVSMSRDYGISPDSKHYVSITDLLGRAGDFMRVKNIVQRMSKQADLTMWLFLLGACRTHGNVELAKQAFEYALSLEPKQVTAYVSMSNIYAEAGDARVMK